jgi:alkylated DNA nucleotide flippase Atl1
VSNEALSNRTPLTFARMASRIQPGEWATYGDISRAVQGDHKAARGVGRAAVTQPDFPAPWRVLNTDGLIHPNWRDAEGRGPEEARRRLRAEGVQFDEDNRARQEFRVRWDVLRQRDDQAPAE